MGDDVTEIVPGSDHCQFDLQRILKHPAEGCRESLIHI
jgi:hypothetical protein